MPHLIIKKSYLIDDIEENAVNSTKKTIDILLVEDNSGDVRLTQEALKEGKVANQLFVVNDGVEALDFLYHRNQYVDSVTPGLILLDLNLPRKDGREVLAEIKNDPILKLIPVVILTTSDKDTDILRSYNLHANCYITKPINFDQFLNVVRLISDFWLTVVKLPAELDKNNKE